MPGGMASRMSLTLDASDSARIVGQASWRPPAGGAVGCDDLRMTWPDQAACRQDCQAGLGGLGRPHIKKRGGSERGVTDHERRWSVLPGLIIQVSKIEWGRLSRRHRVLWSEC